MLAACQGLGESEKHSYSVECLASFQKLGRGESEGVKSSVIGINVMFLQQCIDGDAKLLVLVPLRL